MHDPVADIHKKYCLTRMLHEGFGFQGQVGNKSSGKIYRASRARVSLMDETNNRVVRSPA